MSVYKSIQAADIRINPFKAFKKWYGDSSSLYTRYEGLLVTDLSQLSVPYPQATNTTSNGKLKGAVHQSINHLFYKNYYDNNSQTFGLSGQLNQERKLYDFATVLSLPQSKTGEGILPTSIKLQYSSLLNGSGFLSSPVAIVDDGESNLVYSTNIDTTGSFTTFYDFDGNALGLPTLYITPTSFRKVLDEHWVYRLETDRFRQSLNTTIQSGSLNFWLNGWSAKIDYNQITPVTTSRGLGLQFNSSSVSSSLTLIPQNEDLNNRYNFTNSDYSIGFCVNITGSTNYSGVILEKKSFALGYGYNSVGQLITEPVYKYPYSLTMDYTAASNSWNLSFRKSDGVNTTTCSIASLSGSSTYHIWLTRSGSNYNMAAAKINTYPSQSFPTQAVLSASVVDTLTDQYCGNPSSIYIGRDSQYNSGSTMVFDGLSVYDSSYNIDSPEHLFQVFSGGRNSLNVGNAFYKHGLLVLTNPQTYDRQAPYATKYPTNLEYRSTVTIRETQVYCTINPGEYAYTTNPTAQTYDGVSKQYKLAGFATSSVFTPYVTQIGLYDNNNNLLAIGKLNKALRPPGNVDTTFVVKFDR